jgi:hypothetical protein
VSVSSGWRARTVEVNATKRPSADTDADRETPTPSFWRASTEARAVTARRTSPLFTVESVSHPISAANSEARKNRLMAGARG